MVLSPEVPGQPLGLSRSILGPARQGSRASTETRRTAAGGSDNYRQVKEKDNG